MSNKSNSKHNFYEQIYNDYKTQIFDSQEKYYDWYRQANNLLEAIEKAFLSKISNKRGEIKNHPHQHNIYCFHPEALPIASQIACKRYETDNISNNDFNSFAKIYKFVGLIRNEVYGFGELAHYDVSLRITKYQDTKYPGCGDLTEVYLHAGTLKGAKAIFNARDLDKSIQKSDLKEGSKISVTFFPHPLNTLSGDHLENLLCIYKQQLKEQKIKIFDKKQKSCIKSQKTINKSCT